MPNGTKKYLLSFTLMIAVLVGVAIGAAIERKRAQRDREILGDAAYIALSHAMTYGKLCREGDTAQILSSSDDGLRKALLYIGHHQMNHPGAGNWGYVVDQYVRDFRIELSSEERKVLDEMKAKGSGGSDVFLYHYR